MSNADLNGYFVLNAAKILMPGTRFDRRVLRRIAGRIADDSDGRIRVVSITELQSSNGPKVPPGRRRSVISSKVVRIALREHPQILHLRVKMSRHGHCRSW